MPVTVLVDGNNVIGSRPDGWWRDRAGAARTLLTRLQRYAAATGAAKVAVVFDALPRDMGEGCHDRVQVFGPTRHGRDAADDRIVDLVAQRDAARGLGPEVEVITSDRVLAERARALGASVTGASAFLRRLEACGC
jgi:predicted RNA-binding protein with PIN domain